MLEDSDEPEVLMADMSVEQLMAFTDYDTKVQAVRQSNKEKAVEKALKAADLYSREVTPLMRVKVVGLNNISHHGIRLPKEGLITIWDPTENQNLDLVEGKDYDVWGLKPSRYDNKTLSLQAKGSTARWRPLTSEEINPFAPFFKPRISVGLSQLWEIPSANESDITALVIHVGREYAAGHQKRQWVFATDGSMSLLAISFCSPHGEDESLSPINQNLVGSTVGFCNLIKGEKDKRNALWVAEATENSIYYLDFGNRLLLHLSRNGQKLPAGILRSCRRRFD